MPNQQQVHEKFISRVNSNKALAQAGYVKGDYLSQFPSIITYG